MQNRILSGYVQVKRKRFWVIRFVEIYSNSQLCYYYNKGNEKPRFIMSLIGADITEENIESKGNEHCIKIMQKNKEISLLTDSQKDHNQWIEILKECSKSQNIYNNNTQIGQQNYDSKVQNKLSRFQDLDIQEDSCIYDVQRPFVFDKKVIQGRFQGDDQLMLKANTSFFISEYKDLILTKVEEGMKTYMCKMGIIKQSNNNDKNLIKNPAKEILSQIYSNVNDLRQVLGYQIFILVFITVFILLFMLFYILFEVLNTTSIFLSFLACINLFILPYYIFQGQKRTIQTEKLQYRVKIQMQFPHNLNHFLFVIQQLEDRQQWHPNVKKLQVQKETVFLQSTDFDIVSSEYFQTTIYQEQKFIYIIEHQKSHILRVYQLNYHQQEYGSFELQFYFKTQAAKPADLQNLINENLIKSLSIYIQEQKSNFPESPLNKYIQLLNKLETDVMDQNELNFKSVMIKNQKSLIMDNNQQNQKKLNQQKQQQKSNNNTINSNSNKKSPNQKQQRGSDIDGNFSLKMIDLSNSKIDEISLEESNIKIKDKSQSIDQSNIQKSNLSNQQQNQEESQQKVDLNKVNSQQEQQVDSNQIQQDSQLSSEQLKYEEQIQIALQNLNREIQLIPENNWEKQDSKGTWNYHTKEIGNIVYLRAEMVFDCDKDTLLNDYLLKEELRTKYDEMFDSGNNYGEVCPNIILVRNQLKGQFPVKSRDFMLLQKAIIQDSINYLVISGTCDFDEKYPHKKSVIRGFIQFGGWVLEKISDNQCKAIFMANSDPKGGLPTIAKKIGSTRQAKGVKKLKELVDKLQQKK